MKGTEGSEYEGGELSPLPVPVHQLMTGLYHLRILLPTTYPMSAPDIIFMTPNGRFELGKKVNSSCELGESWLMVDLHRRLNFFPRWIMATSLGRTHW